jgi:hypothetical protein
MFSQSLSRFGTVELARDASVAAAELGLPVTFGYEMICDVE